MTSAAPASALPASASAVLASAVPASAALPSAALPSAASVSAGHQYLPQMFWASAYNQHFPPYLSMNPQFTPANFQALQYNSNIPQFSGTPNSQSASAVPLTFSPPASSNGVVKPPRAAQPSESSLRMLENRDYMFGTASALYHAMNQGYPFPQSMNAYQVMNVPTRPPDPTAISRSSTDMNTGTSSLPAVPHSQTRVDPDPSRSQPRVSCYAAVLLFPVCFCCSVGKPSTVDWNYFAL